MWDCGGQNAFVDNYLTAQKDTIFANVAVLIYVFDITSTEWETDLRYFEDILTALRANSEDAGVWVLINKMDLVDKEDTKRKKYGERKADILNVDERIRGIKVDDAGKGDKGMLRCFPTSIWDESLYKVSFADTYQGDSHSQLGLLGLVVCHSYSHPQHRPDHFSSYLFTQRLRSCRGGRLRV